MTSGSTSHTDTRDVGWVKDIDPASALHGGHGTYWECCASIMARGVPPASDTDARYGAREWHDTTGVYTSKIFEAYAIHYAWLTNVFGNRAFHGVAFRIIANPAYLRNEFNRLKSRTKHEWVIGS